MTAPVGVISDRGQPPSGTASSESAGAGAAATPGAVVTSGVVVACGGGVVSAPAGGVTVESAALAADGPRADVMTLAPDRTKTRIASRLTKGLRRRVVMFFFSRLSGSRAWGLELAACYHQLGRGVARGADGRERFSCGRADPRARCATASPHRVPIGGNRVGELACPSQCSSSLLALGVHELGAEHALRDVLVVRPAPKCGATLRRRRRHASDTTSATRQEKFGVQTGDTGNRTDRRHG